MFNKYFKSDSVRTILTYMVNVLSNNQDDSEKSNNPDVRKGSNHAKEAERKRKHLEKERNETIERIQKIVHNRNEGWDEIADEEPPGGRYW